MDNQMLRSFFKMTKGMTGLLVTHIEENSCPKEILRKNDILMEVDDIPIHEDGEVIVGTLVCISMVTLPLREIISLKLLKKEKSKSSAFMRSCLMTGISVTIRLLVTTYLLDLFSQILNMILRNPSSLLICVGYMLLWHVININSSSNFVGLGG